MAPDGEQPALHCLSLQVRHERHHPKVLFPVAVQRDQELMTGGLQAVVRRQPSHQLIQQDPNALGGL